MSKQQGLKSTNLTKIFISSENELWEWLDVNHASEQSFLLVTWKKTNTEKYVSRDIVLDALLAYGWIDGRRYALDKTGQCSLSANENSRIGQILTEKGLKS